MVISGIAQLTRLRESQIAANRHKRHKKRKFTQDRGDAEKTEIAQQGHKGHEGLGLASSVERSVFVAFVTLLFSFAVFFASWREFLGL
jgi:hypothetical protein